MPEQLLKVAVVGHTNVGKTSLLRTLTRDRTFGEVSIHPATTRHVEAARLDLGTGLGLEFDDTPGFEDSIGLLDALHQLDPDPRTPGPARLARFLDSPAATTGFPQEAKALRQLLATDLALYVVDAREPISGRFADEFVILSWSGKPCLVVLNFVASAGDPAAWRAALQQAGLHNTVEFDTVVFNPDDEQRLLRQLAVLLPAADRHVEQLIDLRATERTGQLDTAAVLIAGALIDCAQIHATGPAADTGMQQAARKRERRLNRELLALFRFAESDYAPSDLPISGAEWSIDLFNTEVLQDVGLSLGGSAATGAAAGAAVDLLTGFTSLGAATLIGGTIGAGLDGLNRLRQYFGGTAGERAGRELDPATLRFLARRACRLVMDLAYRGHAAVQPLIGSARLDSALLDEERITAALAVFRHQPAWARSRSHQRQDRAREALREWVRQNLPS